MSRVLYNEKAGANNTKTSEWVYGCWRVIRYRMAKTNSLPLSMTTLHLKRILRLKNIMDKIKSLTGGKKHRQDGTISKFQVQKMRIAQILCCQYIN